MMLRRGRHTGGMIKICIFDRNVCMNEGMKEIREKGVYDVLVPNTSLM